MTLFVMLDMVFETYLNLLSLGFGNPHEKRCCRLYHIDRQNSVIHSMNIVPCQIVKPQKACNFICNGHFKAS